MKRLWTYIEGKTWHAETKYRIILLILGTVFAAACFAVWLIVRNWALSTWDWMVCFIGYPVIVSWFVVFFYSCNHDFHSGRSRKQYD